MIHDKTAAETELPGVLNANFITKIKNLLNMSLQKGRKLYCKFPKVLPLCKYLCMHEVKAHSSLFQ